MRLHVVSLPHTETTRRYDWCAFTSRARKFCDMMHGLGHHVTLYAGPRSEAICDELVACTGPLGAPGEIPDFDAANPLFAAFNARVVVELADRIEPRDFICIIGGTAQQPIAEAFPAHQVVEFGIGYVGTFAPYRVFDSYAWMHAIYGAERGDAGRADGRFFDAVIPNSYDPEDFPLGAGDGGYLLYVGRLIERKGVQIAVETARAAALPLKVAGYGDYPLPDDVEYVGIVGPQRRAELMGDAIALLCPTLYLEPFGGVAVEAQLCGTPAITTDFGAFPETVEHGVSGFRCHTMAEFVDAAERAPHLDRRAIQERAIGRYSLDAVAPRYDSYFRRLQTLWADGFYEGLERGELVA